MGTNNNIKAPFDEHFRHYCEEMRQYDPDFCTDEEMENFKNTVKDMCVILPVKSGNKAVGFVAVSARDCHPKCDWYIHHAFVEKQYRHRQLMTHTIFTWLINAPGIYGYDVIKDSPKSHANIYAEGYWKHIFEDLVGKFKRVDRITLNPIREPEAEAKLNIHAYRISQITSPQSFLF